MSGSLAPFSRSLVGGPSGSAPAGGRAQTPPEIIGRRAAARLRTAIPAKLITVSETRHCILVDISCTGARIALPNPLATGDAGFVRFAEYEVFGCVTRREPDCNGLEFDVPLTASDLLSIRSYAEAYEVEEKRSTLAAARAWVTGTL